MWSSRKLHRLGAPMTPLELVQLPWLMELTSGSRDVVIGLIDGPVACHEELQLENVRHLPVRELGVWHHNGPAGEHGTFVAGILTGRRGGSTPGICPGCTLLVRPVLQDHSGAINGLIPHTILEQVAEGIIECV